MGTRDRTRNAAPQQRKARDPGVRRSETLPIGFI
jgi:hypothetical protein